jgi:hypothetical protein
MLYGAWKKSKQRPDQEPSTPAPAPLSPQANGDIASAPLGLRIPVYHEGWLNFRRPKSWLFPEGPPRRSWWDRRRWR